MNNHVVSQFEIDSWEETTVSQVEDGPNVIRASVTQSYTGDLEGEGKLEYLMTTFDDTFSTFMGTEQFVGELKNRRGSFVLSHEGTHENGVAKSKYHIVENSGTGELTGIRGEGEFEATEQQVKFSLDYYFEE